MELVILTLSAVLIYHCRFWAAVLLWSTHLYCWNNLQGEIRISDWPIYHVISSNDAGSSQEGWCGASSSRWFSFSLFYLFFLNVIVCTVCDCIKVKVLQTLLARFPCNRKMTDAIRTKNKQIDKPKGLEFHSVSPEYPNQIFVNYCFTYSHCNCLYIIDK